MLSEAWSGGSGNRELSHTYVYGLERISQMRSYLVNNTTHTQTSYYAYDGHGSTRALTDPSGSVTDTYDYDAFGNLIHSTATGIPPGGTTVTATPNEFLFAGEQFDSDLNLYYNRARYLNISNGRFISTDTDEGGLFEPLSLHKYLYANSDPVNRTDPSGHDSIADFSFSFAVQAVLATIAIVALSTVLQNVKSEVGMRLNHYTRWIYLPLIMLGGINSPKGANYFTPDFYTSGSAAQRALVLPETPQLFINLTVYEFGDRLNGPEDVPGGTGRQYWTLRVIPFWTRWPILFPLEEEINSILPKPLP